MYLYPLNKGLTISIYFQGISYVTISQDYNCGHTSGGEPSYCSLGEGIQETQCELVCTSLSGCVAYSFMRARKACIFVTSTGSCTVGTFLPGHTAASIDQMVAGTWGGYYCKGKVAGNNKYITSYTQ